MRRVVASAVLAAAVVASAGCASSPPPVSQKVADFYEANKNGPTIGPSKALPIVAFVGDSFTAGAGSTDPGVRWASRTANAMTWNEKNLGLGGTGYVTSATREACGVDYCETYPERLNEVIEAKPSIVVVAGGLNDQYSDPAAIDIAVRGFYKDLRTKLPKAKIVAVSPVWRDGNPPPIIADIQASVKAAAAANKATYLDIGQPLAGKDDVLASDGAHPNDAGHGLIATATIKALQGAGF